MMRILALLALVGLAGCMASPPPNGSVQTVQPTLPAGYPPKIGSVQAKLNGKTVAWDSYDYSIGAYDASVQVLTYNGEIQFRLMGETPGKPGQDVNRLVMKAVMTDESQTGTLTKPVIEIVPGKDWNGPRLTSVASDTRIVLDSLTPMGPQGAYGHVKGHFSASLCAATGGPTQIVLDRGNCQTFGGTFSSDLQIGGP